MVIITDVQGYVRVDLSAFIALEEVRYHTIYIMKDKTVDVRLDKSLKWVEVTTTRDRFMLDQSGVNGLPCKVGLTIPLTNVDLALALAELRNL
jgi:hypothetical protein